MIKCELVFTSQTAVYALDYKPAGKKAYDLAQGKNFDRVDRLYENVTIEIPLRLAIRSSGIFENSFFGTVYVEKNSLLWAVSWYVDNNVLKPLINKQLIVAEWELAKFPKKWDAIRTNNYKKLYRTKLAKKIGKLERKIVDYKNQLLDVVGCDNFDELERCTKETCVYPKYYDKCVGKFANVCEAF